MTLHHDKKSYGKISHQEELSAENIDDMVKLLNQTQNNQDEDSDKPKRCDK